MSDWWESGVLRKQELTRLGLWKDYQKRKESLQIAWQALLTKDGFDTPEKQEREFKRRCAWRSIDTKLRDEFRPKDGGGVLAPRAGHVAGVDLDASMAPEIPPETTAEPAETTAEPEAVKQASDIDGLRWALENFANEEENPKGCPAKLWRSFLEILRSSPDAREKGFLELIKIVLKRAEEKEARFRDDGRDVLELIADVRRVGGCIEPFTLPPGPDGDETAMVGVGGVAREG